MKWKSQKDKDEYYSASISDPWKIGIMKFAEDLGEWIENGNSYRSFPISPELDQNQVGTGLVLLLSEWEQGDSLWDMLTTIEQKFVAFYVHIQIQAAQYYASQNSPDNIEE